MYSKNKFLVALVLIFGAVLLTGAGCAKKSVSPAPTPKGAGAPAVAPVKEEANKPAGESADVGKMTDDVYVEITAQMNYSLGKGELKYAGDEGFADLLKEHGVTKENFDAFSTALTADTARTASVGMKVMQRLKELAK